MKASADTIELHTGICMHYEIIVVSIPALVSHQSGVREPRIRRMETAFNSLSFLICSVKPATHRVHGKGLTEQIRNNDCQSSRFKVVSINRNDGFFFTGQAVSPYWNIQVAWQTKSSRHILKNNTTPNSKGDNIMRKTVRLFIRMYGYGTRTCRYCGYTGSRWPDSGECPSCGEVN